MDPYYNKKWKAFIKTDVYKISVTDLKKHNFKKPYIDYMIRNIFDAGWKAKSEEPKL